MALPARANSSSYQNPGKRSVGSGGFAAANDNQIAAQLYSSKNRARRQQQEYNKDPNEADRLEIEDLETEIKQTDSNSSLTARDLGNGSIGIDLKFDVPLNPGRARNIAQWKANRKKFQTEEPETSPEPVQPEEEGSLSPANDNELLGDDTQSGGAAPGLTRTAANNSLDELRQTPQEQNSGDELTPTDDNELADILDEDYNPYPLPDETAPESEPSSVNDSPDGSDQDTTAQANSEEAARDAQRQQAEAEQQQALEQAQTQEQQKQTKDVQKQQKQKNAEQQIAEVAKQNALKEQQNQSQLLRAAQMKQKLDKKLRKLRAEKLVLKVLLYTTKILKAIVDAIQSVVRWLASFCMSLAWTIILGIVGVLLYIAYGLLFIPKGTLYATIKLTEKRIKTIDKDIAETKKNQQKVVSMIQSLMAQRRKGSPPQEAPKFNVPQQAS